ASPALSQSGTKPASTIVAVTGTDPAHLNSAITTAGGVHTIAASLYDGLVELDSVGRPLPGLAERWDVKDGGRTYVFHLRHDVAWHDGVPFTSRDVTYTFAEMLLKYSARTKAGLEPALAGIDAPDDTTVIFRFKAPYAPLLKRLTVDETPILPRHLYEGTDPLTNPYNQHPVGTGPYRFVEWLRGDRIVFARNPRYFVSGRARIERVVWRILPNVTAQTIALERGEADYLGGVEGPQLARLRAAPGVRLGRSPAGAGGGWCVNTLIPNLRRHPLDDARVRRALSLSIDRAFLADRLYQGTASPARGPFHTALGATDRIVEPLAFDSSRAARFFDAAGASRRNGGSRLQLRFAYGTPGFEALAETLRDQFARVGVELVLDPMDFNAAVEKVFIKQDFDLGVASYCNGADPDIGVKRVYDSRNILPIPFGNGAGYRNAVVDSLFDLGAGTLDPARRRAIYGTVQRVLLDDVPYLWLVETDGLRAWRAEVRGLRIWSGHTFDEATIVDR
ncbi:MAG: ABC transporter substrate-binding protein, partial [Gemmatimonadaceae bacterium]